MSASNVLGAIVSEINEKLTWLWTVNNIPHVCCLGGELDGARDPAMTERVTGTREKVKIFR